MPGKKLSLPPEFYPDKTHRIVDNRPFVPEALDKTVIAVPLLKAMFAERAVLLAYLHNRATNPPEVSGTELTLIRKQVTEDTVRLPPADLAKRNEDLLARLQGEIAGESWTWELFDVIIDLNLEFPGGRDGAREEVKSLAADVNAQFLNRPVEDKSGQAQGINDPKSKLSNQYLFGRFQGDAIRALVRSDSPTARMERGGLVKGHKPQRALYRIWPDFAVHHLITKSIRTVKVDAARVSFSALGTGVLWAVVDSGIDESHPHFVLHKNLDLLSPLDHRDFSGDGNPLNDAFGHGTHVAGIIAGEQVIAKSPAVPTQNNASASTAQSADSSANSSADSSVPSSSADIAPAPTTNTQGPAAAIPNPVPALAYARHRDESGEITYDPVPIENGISGMAPNTKLISLKVLDSEGNGLASNLIAAIEYIQEVNGYGRRVRIHGVNMSVGYDFEPEWFACGQSPLCVEVDRLVRSGVVVVVAAGNTGYGWAQTAFKGTVAAGLDLTINDPGNAELAITVGSTHRDMPHVYGVSYFSSKGPTGDGRIKPDLVAPGEKILSCAAGKNKQEMIDRKHPCEYVEESGTSMAAPHVSGVIAAFLSVRQEYIGQPERVKEIFMSTATDLKRERYFQGSGLVDLMRAIQSV